MICGAGGKLREHTQSARAVQHIDKLSHKIGTPLKNPAGVNVAAGSAAFVGAAVVADGLAGAETLGGEPVGLMNVRRWTVETSLA